MHRPFEILDAWIRDGRLKLSETTARDATESAPAAESGSDSEATDEELFREAMRDVRPVERNGAAPPPPRSLEIADGDAEDAVLRILEEFCRAGTVAPEHTREYVEHSVDPTGRLYIPDLRSGRFAVQAHLDLHGLTLEAARRIVDLFVRESVRAGYSCVRIVHGRGRHSEGGRPLLKENVERWLRHRRLARYVIAYTSARGEDGGVGAVYVLLRQ